MSVINTILDNVKGAIAGIRISAGYNTDIENVYRYPKSFDSGAETMPWVTIIEDTDTPLFHDSTNMRFLMTGTLNLAVKSDVDLSNKINLIIDDIKTLIYSPVDLGSYVYHMRITNIERIFLGETDGRALAVISFEIHYYAPIAGF